MSDSDAIAEFNPHNLADQLRDKIRIDMAELMPPEMWQALLRTEIEGFFKGKETKDYRGNVSRSPSAFHGIVHEEMTKIAKKLVAEKLEAEWDAGWNAKAGELIMDLIKQNAGEFLSTLLADQMQGMINAFAQQLQQKQGY